MSEFGVSYLLLWVIVIFQILVALAVWNELGELGRRQMINSQGENPRQNRELPPGAIAPKFASVDLRSGALVDSDSLVGRFAILLFLTPQCSQCKTLAAGFMAVPSDTFVSSNTRLVAIAEGVGDECKDFVERLRPEIPFLCWRRGETRRLFGVSQHPTVVILDPQGMVHRYLSPKHSEDILKVMGALDTQPVTSSI